MGKSAERGGFGGGGRGGSAGRAVGEAEERVHDGTRACRDVWGGCEGGMRGDTEGRGGMRGVEGG